MRRRVLVGASLAAVGLVVPLVRALHASQAPASGSHLSDPSSLAELTPLSAPTDALMTGAVEAFRRGDLSRARDLAARAVTAGRREAPLYKLLAVTEYLLGDAEQFEVHIRQALALAPKDADLHYHQARYLYEQKRYGEAAAAFERATTLSPDHYKARYYEGLVAEVMGQPDRALELFGDAIATIERLRVRYVWPHVDLGRLLVDRGDVDRGLGWLYRAVRTDPELPYGHYEYAKALLLS
ncbi:MAG: tetratricopeptide repeat protein, partial [Vicinamibacteraceae bacterium]